MLSCSFNFEFKIEKGDPSNLKIPCMIGHKFIANGYIDLDLPMNVTSLAYYNAIRNQGYEHRGLNFVGIRKDMHVFVGNMSHVMDFTVLNNVEANIDPILSQVVFGRPFVETTKLILDKEKGLITFTDEIKEGNTSDDDFRRAYESQLDLKNGFYKDIDKLGPSYNWRIERLDLEGSFKTESSSVSGERVTAWRWRQKLLLTPSGLKSDDVNPKYDGVTIANKEKPMEDSVG
ncbi:hypothetical protein Tco_1392158 [Tanacetum coccineum]